MQWYDKSSAPTSVPLHRRDLFFLHDTQRSTKKRSPLLSSSGSATLNSSDSAPQHGEQGQQERNEGAVVNDTVGRANGLVLEDGQESQGDDETAGNVTFAVKSVAGSGTLEEDEGDDDGNVAEDAGLVRVSIGAKGGEACDDGEDD